MGGRYTCCTRDHVLKGKSARCDKVKVRHVIAKMLDGQIDHLLSTGRAMEHRYFVCARKLFFTGLPASELGSETQPTLAELKAKIAWRADEEDLVARTSGWSLLHYVVLSDNLLATKELLHRGGQARYLEVHVQRK